MPLLQPSDLIQAAGVRMEAQVPQPGMVLCRKDPERPLLWYAPSTSRTLDDGTVQIWYQRVDKDGVLDRPRSREGTLLRGDAPWRQWHKA